MNLDVYVEKDGAPQRVGVLDTLPGIGEGFVYDVDWLSAHDAYPLSLSLPLGEERFSARKVRPYFEGLLPEGRARAAVAREIRVSASSYAKILASLGWECIGAVVLKGDEPEPEEAYEELDDAQLETMASTLASRASWVNETTRFSLTGGQPKAALFRDREGRWKRSIGSAPSTHILKPTHAKYSDAAVNEAVCALAASNLGLNVPEIEIVPTEIPMVCTERFDRIIDATSRCIGEDRAPHRLHQEDFAQAMGVVSEHKYEEKGRRSYTVRIAETIRLYSSDPLADLQEFWRGLVFNFIIGNCDAHLKNYALLRSADWKNLRLAPFYDLLGTSYYEGLSTELAMRIGGVAKLEKIDSEAFERQAQDMGLPASWAMGEALRIITASESAIEWAAEQLSAQDVVDAQEVAEHLLPGVRERARRIG